MSVLVGGMIGFLVSYAIFTPRLTRLEEQVILRPPVVVVDMAKLAIELVPVGTGQVAIDAHVRNTQHVIDKFTRAGFLVLRRENVLSAPNSVMLAADEIPKNPYVSGEYQ